jgi:hypothetical protein
MGGGSNSSKSSSRPLNARERKDIFNTGISSVQEATPWLQSQNLDYQAPEMQRLAGGDYDQLEQSLLGSQTSMLDSQWANRKDSINQDMADRGLYASGIGAQAENEIFASDFLPAYQQAAAGATAQRYGMESQDNAMANQMAMSNAGQDFASQWAPYEYLMGLYNNTGGTISSSKSGGWNFSI